MARATRPLHIVLMIRFCWPESLGRFHLGDNVAPTKRTAFAPAIDEGLCFAALCIVNVPNARPILRTDIRPLSVALCGVVHFEKSFEQSSKSNALRIEHHLDRLGVARDAVTNLLVRRLVNVPLHVSALSVDHARAKLKVMLKTPETATGEIGRLCSFTLILDVRRIHGRSFPTGIAWA